MTRLKRRIWICIIASLLAFPLMWLSAYLMTRALQPHRAEIELYLQQESHLPIKVKDLQVRWWASVLPTIVLKQVVIDDNVSVEEIIVNIDLKNTLQNKTLKIDTLTLKNLHAAIENGLAQKTLDPTILLAFLSKQGIVLENADILWKRSNPIAFRINGKLTSKEDLLSFTGDTAFSVGGGDFLKLNNIDLILSQKQREAKFKADLLHTDLQGSLQWPENSAPQLNFEAKGRNIDMGFLHRNLKVKPEDSEWLSWVLAAIEKANLSKLNLRIAGPLGGLDFSGTFAIEDLVLLYEPTWPKIEGAEGSIVLDRQAVRVKLDKGRIGENIIQSVSSVIGPLNDPTQSTVVAVETKIVGQLEQGISVLQHSPLKEGLGKRLSDLQLTGPMQVNLSLRIPLHSSEPSTVDGHVRTKNAEFFIEELNLPGKALQGDFHFTSSTIEVENASADFLDTHFQIDAHQNQINATGLVTSSFLQTKFDLPLFKSFEGSALMTASIFVDQDYWQLSSDLKGIKIDLPPPFHKTADQTKPLKFTLYPVVKDERRFALNIEGLMEGKWVVSSPSQQLKRGEMVFGAKPSAKWPIEDSLSIKGALPQLDVNTWWQFLKKTDTSNKLPLHLQISSDVLHFFGLNFEKTTLGYNSSAKTVVSLEGPTIKGTISLPMADNKAINLQFDRLHIKSNTLSKDMDLTLLQDVNRSPVVFLANELKFDQAWFGKVAFQLQPNNEGYEIQNLSAKATSFLLEARGLWQLNSPNNTTNLSGELYSTDMGQTFMLWGFKSAIRESTGRLKFDLHWPGAPFQFSLQALAGNVDLDIKSGHIIGVDPGLGRIFGLLSLDSIRRRLQLDFSDLFKKGFAFDVLHADIHFNQGQAKTNAFTVEGPAANIRMQGTANLHDKSLALILFVRPKVSSSLPIAATIASGGNPAVGAGAWVVEKLIGKSVSKISEHQYKVTGTWDSPKIAEFGEPTRGRKK